MSETKEAGKLRLEITFIDIIQKCKHWNQLQNNLLILSPSNSFYNNTNSNQFKLLCNVITYNVFIHNEKKT